ncbi:hypothetical protein K440DRAFT_642708 [Wilcoxina mikolae CBS 423.85]|nr:hypothetical protein K440DRAFT_642708 [Wilcoxina mikolae CBS 423.85]
MASASSPQTTASACAPDRFISQNNQYSTIQQTPAISQIIELQIKPPGDFINEGSNDPYYAVIVVDATDPAPGKPFMELTVMVIKDHGKGKTLAEMERIGNEASASSPGMGIPVPTLTWAPPAPHRNYRHPNVDFGVWRKATPGYVDTKVYKVKVHVNAVWKSFQDVTNNNLSIQISPGDLNNLRGYRP